MQFPALLYGLEKIRADPLRHLRQRTRPSKEKASKVRNEMYMRWIGFRLELHVPIATILAFVELFSCAALPSPEYSEVDLQPNRLGIDFFIRLTD